MKRRVVRVCFSLMCAVLLSGKVAAAEMLIPVGEVIGIELSDGSVSVAAFDDALGQSARAAGLKIGDRIVAVDDHPVDETRFGLENGITRAVYTSLEKTELPATVPEGCVFVLGDNRRVSEDSRYAEVGMIDVRNVLGKAVWFVSPVSKFGWIGG